MRIRLIWEGKTRNAQLRELHRLAGVALELEVGCWLAFFDHLILFSVVVRAWS